MNGSLRFLVVDDFSTMRRIIRNFLNDLGYGDVTEAEDGQTALQILAQGNIDFLITDWNMPGMPGIDLLKAVRADPILAKLPVLLVTAEPAKERNRQAIQSGVSGFIVKPFTPVMLKNEIDKILLSRSK